MTKLSGVWCRGKDAAKSTQLGPMTGFASTASFQDPCSILALPLDWDASLDLGAPPGPCGRDIPQRIRASSTAQNLCTYPHC